MTDRFTHLRTANTVGQPFQMKSINAAKLHLNKLQATLSFSIDIINISIRVHVTFVNMYIFVFHLCEQRAERPSWVTAVSRELCHDGGEEEFGKVSFRTPHPLPPPLPPHTAAALSADVCRHRTPSSAKRARFITKTRLRQLPLLSELKPVRKGMESSTLGRGKAKKQVLRSRTPIQSPEGPPELLSAS